MEKFGLHLAAILLKPNGAFSPTEKPTMTAQETKQAMQAAAQRLGFALIYSNLRTGCFHIKKGTTVRRGWVWRNIKPDDIFAQINSTSQHGDRLDTMRESAYFNPTN
jgi:hypothetical protein